VLSYAGSLATLLWRRALAPAAVGVPRLAEWSLLGLATVPVTIVVATASLWLSVRWMGT